ncbi:DUF72 domain-containing protein [Microlunatus soli]|uniref:Uncharacterized conserved protein YecE, DUF72 family n=1 Tax=Microlunatus soli TaxID=630515 RepID=A0A1H1NV35_9ACTN|nr:DUF72 domain-containing protein [Microlunatus soli]SDS02828.1 Uncharacterized conserved protein YecE, DUF72 family [Microlunatus soli]
MIRVGISGWTYQPWRGSFYPAGLPHRQELGYAAERLTSIEVNGTFYALQRPSSFANWREQTPDDFVFSVKGGRFITHMKRLLDPQLSLANFFASGPLALADKLGPMLWQLAPDLTYDAGRLTAFFDALPRTHAEAIAVGSEHDDRLDQDRVHLQSATPERPIRHAVEVRNDTFNTPELIDLLHDHRIALVIADTAGRWPQIEQLTTDFGYLRLHGADELYVSGYPPSALDAWADKINSWADQVDDVFVYFDNDAKVRAPYDAIGLIERLSESTS